jgi:hypothetical protein
MDVGRCAFFPAAQLWEGEFDRRIVGHSLRTVALQRKFLEVHG